MLDIVVAVALGLLGLSIIVFVHELGHFLAARWMGVEVEAFAIGWGKTIWSFRSRRTEYRLALFPLGGYCKMKGENYLLSALSNPAVKVVAEPGSFYAAAPWRRIIIAVAGPLFNLVFAFLAFFLLFQFPSPYSSPSNRVVLSSQYPEITGVTQPTPADLAGLQSGDLILAIKDQPIQSFEDLQTAVNSTPDKALPLQISRSGQVINLTVEPTVIDGNRRIGVSYWIDLKVKSLEADSPTVRAGLLPGDVIQAVNGQAIGHYLDLLRILKSNLPSYDFTYQRSGQSYHTTVVPVLNKPLGFKEFELPKFTRSPLGFWPAAEQSYAKTVGLVGQILGGLGQLFTGKTNLMESISGPIRNTYMIGELTSQSFAESFGEGITAFVRFLSLFSVALFVMNLLPLPALDGGMVIINLVETAWRRPIRPIILVRYQQIGVLIIVALVILATISDFSFFSKVK